MFTVGGGRNSTNENGFGIVIMVMGQQQHSGFLAEAALDCFPFEAKGFVLLIFELLELLFLEI